MDVAMDIALNEVNGEAIEVEHERGVYEVKLRGKDPRVVKLSTWMQKTDT